MIKYVVEVRDKNGRLNIELERQKKKEHPYLFSKRTFTIDDLCWYGSYGQDRNNPMGPMELPKFMKSIGILYREKYW